MKAKYYRIKHIDKDNILCVDYKKESELKDMFLIVEKREVSKEIYDEKKELEKNGFYIIMKA